MKPSRRLFLQQAGALSTLGSAAAPFALNLAAMGSAAAETATDYKAIVCVFLYGGNDAYNTVLATDASSWSAYNAVRNQAPSPIALMSPYTPVNTAAAAGSPARLGGVLPINPTTTQGRSFALHPVLGTLQTMFNSERRLAVVANVGPLVTPTTKAQALSLTHPKPPKLYSHNDQQSVWQAFAPEGSARGWGGRMADMLAAMNGTATFSAISAGGSAVWLSGQTVKAYQVGPTGPVRLPTDPNGTLYNSATVGSALIQAMTGNAGHVLQADMGAVARRSADAEMALRNALRPATDPMWGTAPPSGGYWQVNDPKLRYTSPLTGATAPNPLAQQLQVVARMIDASNASGIGARRQVFFVGINAFDTHSNQSAQHADALAKLAHALRYFDTTLGAMGARSKVTTFTASDFGRSFTSNGDGTDHGWGGHHFVMGGAVRGGEIYGRFPTLGLKNVGDNGFDSSPDQLQNGVLLPALSVDQYGATLGRWFGLSDTQLATVFPNLGNFATKTLGFL